MWGHAKYPRTSSKSLHIRHIISNSKWVENNGQNCYGNREKENFVARTLWDRCQTVKHLTSVWCTVWSTWWVLMYKHINKKNKKIKRKNENRRILMLAPKIKKKVLQILINSKTNKQI